MKVNRQTAEEAVLHPIKTLTHADDDDTLGWCV